jgi:polysaccharide export outer membrane protein
MKAIKVFLIIGCLFVFGINAQTANETDQKKTNDSETKTLNPPEVKSDKVDNSVNSDPFSNQDFQIPIANLRNNTEIYRIGFQDILQVVVYRHPELSQTVSVGQDGRIYLPRIKDPIVAVCKTDRELAQLITELYKNYLRTPFVNVRTVEQRSQPFAVIGAVNKPGNFYLNQKVRLLQLLSLAGGQDVEKSGSRIQVARIGNLSACSPSDERDGDVEFFAYELNDVLSGKSNPWMEPGDIVSVLEASEAYVVGEVFEPAKILLKEPVTLSEAIAKAGGLGPNAKTTKVVIQRKEKGSPVRTELVFNLKEIKAKNMPDPLLQANDIVEVSSSQGKVIKKSLWKIFTQGLPNIFYRLPL